MAKSSDDKAPAKRNPLIITRSELEQLSEVDQQTFRKRNGTVTEDPAPEPDQAPAPAQ